MFRRPALAKTAAATALVLAAFVGHRYVLPRIGLADGPAVPVGAVLRLSATAPARIIGASVALAGERMTPLDAAALQVLRDRSPATYDRLTPRPSPAATDALRALPAGEAPCLEGACPARPAVAADPQITGSIALAGLGDEALPPPAPVRQARVFAAVDVLDGRSFRADGATVRLADLALPGPRQQCRRLDGVSEPCASRTRTRLDLMTRHRPVTCDLAPPTSVTAPLTGACRVGNTDLALWLIREGWATPAADTPEAAAALAEARRLKAGIWR
jgi:endonuclease YncB( thermonuclease family)